MKSKSQVMALDMQIKALVVFAILTRQTAEAVTIRDVMNATGLSYWIARGVLRELEDDALIIREKIRGEPTVTYGYRINALGESART